MTALEVRELSKTYGARVVLDRLSLSVDHGQVTGLLGANGAGKTTAIGVMLGLLRGSGEARFAGRRLEEHSVPGSVVGAAPDGRPLLTWWTARQHLVRLAPAVGAPLKRADDLLGLVGLEHAADRAVREYSLGMRQRLSLALALLGSPQLLVLDEPMTGLDPPGLRWLGGLIRAFAAEGGAVLLSSHHLADLDGVVDRVAVLDQGHLTTEDDVVAYVARHATTVVRARTRDVTGLLTVLAAVGGEVVSTTGDTVRFVGVQPEAVARAAVARGLVMYELALEHGGLREAFMASNSFDVPVGREG